MTQGIDKETMFWQAMTALKDAIETGQIDIKNDMPDLYQAISRDTRDNLRQELDSISSHYAQQGSDFINEKLKNNLKADKEQYQSLAKQFNDLQWGIKVAEKRLESLSQRQKNLKVNDWVLEGVISVGFVMISLSSLGILATLLNLFGGVAFKELWSQVFLGSFSMQAPTWGGAITIIIIKLLVSAIFLLIGCILVFSPWFVFNWLLAKTPYKFRKSLALGEYRGW